MKKVLLFIAFLCCLSTNAANGIISNLVFSVGIIKGGTITNAYLDMKVGSHLKFQNGGLLVCRTNNNFYAPQGAIVNMNDEKYVIHMISRE